MKDLISRQEVIATIKAQMPKSPMRSTLVHMINIMECAYDMDKVVERLEEASVWLESSYEDEFCEDDCEPVILLDEAIKIVKGEV